MKWSTSVEGGSVAGADQIRNKTDDENVEGVLPAVAVIKDSTGARGRSPRLSDGDPQARIDSALNHYESCRRGGLYQVDRLHDDSCVRSPRFAPREEKASCPFLTGSLLYYDHDDQTSSRVTNIEEAIAAAFGTSDYEQASSHREGVRLETVIPYDFNSTKDTILIHIPHGYGASSGKTMEIKCERFKPGAAVAIPVPKFFDTTKERAEVEGAERKAEGSAREEEGGGGGESQPPPKNRMEEPYGTYRSRRASHTGVAERPVSLPRTSLHTDFEHNLMRERMSAHMRPGGEGRDREGDREEFPQAAAIKLTDENERSIRYSCSSRSRSMSEAGLDSEAGKGVFPNELEAFFDRPRSVAGGMRGSSDGIWFTDKKADHRRLRVRPTAAATVTAIREKEDVAVPPESTPGLKVHTTGKCFGGCWQFSRKADTPAAGTPDVENTRGAKRWYRRARDSFTSISARSSLYDPTTTARGGEAIVPSLSVEFGDAENTRGVRGWYRRVRDSVTSTSARSSIHDVTTITTTTKGRQAIVPPVLVEFGGSPLCATFGRSSSLPHSPPGGMLWAYPTEVSGRQPSEHSNLNIAQRSASIGSMVQRADSWSVPNAMGGRAYEVVACQGLTLDTNMDSLDSIDVVNRMGSIHEGSTDEEVEERDRLKWSLDDLMELERGQEQERRGAGSGEAAAALRVMPRSEYTKRMHRRSDDERECNHEDVLAPHPDPAWAGWATALTTTTGRRPSRRRSVDGLAGVSEDPQVSCATLETVNPKLVCYIHMNREPYTLNERKP